MTSPTITDADREAMRSYDAINPYADDDAFLTVFAAHRELGRREALASTMQPETPTKPARKNKGAKA